MVEWSLHSLFWHDFGLLQASVITQNPYHGYCGMSLTVSILFIQLQVALGLRHLVFHYPPSLERGKGVVVNHCLSTMHQWTGWPRSTFTECQNSWGCSSMLCVILCSQCCPPPPFFSLFFLKVFVVHCVRRLPVLTLVQSVRHSNEYTLHQWSSFSPGARLTL